MDLPTREFQCKGMADQSLNTAFDFYQSFEAIQMHLKTSNRVTCDLVVPWLLDILNKKVEADSAHLRVG